MADRHQLPILSDITLALALLTRLPVPMAGGIAETRGAQAAWAYPVAGLVIALLAGGTGIGVLALGLPASLAAGIVLAAQILLAGALHEDGLADTADGLWGGWSRERRLEIMKDSRIGTYGVLALVLSLLLRWSALAALGAALLPALISASVLSRAAMVAVMAALPPARADGLARSVGRPDKGTALAAAVLALALAAIVVGPAAIALTAAALAAAIASGLLARAKLGGQTGDILGATQQLAEIACLATAVGLLT